METRTEHWDAVYEARPENELTWYEAEPRLSLDLVTEHLRPGEPFIDVGGGLSKLTERLLAAGYGPLSVLDVSPAALAAQKARLGDAVTWIAADVTRWQPDTAYAVWHDRAVFHFLTDADDQAAYVAVLAAALRPGGIAIIATFDENGPERCSGLPVVRYAPRELGALLERLAPGAFEPIAALRHEHVTPKGRTQSFQFSVFRKAGAAAKGG